ncbi:ras GEF [Neolentinus lepideus HHB14362 ss-1]|uniref:Ras GEF n=1 Tax=Neolentinus lepideus HHB14362 ss-1 TaxID=1314782 RepID=A0A165UYH6_9AGAM|nr:ras GEF [Neolentinus lepideus HHB14362 ss-1]
MAALATAAYSAGLHPHMAHSTASTVDHPQRPAEEEQFITTFFCRALYDYEAQDASALSFRRNDIIEVLTRLDSGWWDGLLGEERGWFPSNYVTIITEQEAETALGGSEAPGIQNGLTSDTASVVDLAHSLSRGQPQSESEWLEGDIDYSSGRDAMRELATSAMGGGTQPSDFWVPEVTPDGQIFYVNTQTGEHSRDLPPEHVESMATADITTLTSPSSSRSGPSSGPTTGAATGNGAPIGTRAQLDPTRPAGFGIAKRTGTPEPWVRRLADDGLSYYYYNKVTGQWQWTLPSVDSGTSDDEMARELGYDDTPGNRDTIVASGRMKSESTVSRTRGRGDRTSTYSDDSDVHPRERERSLTSSTQRSISTNGYANTNGHKARSLERNSIAELTSADRLAQDLQQALEPHPPESVTGLSTIAREAIAAVADSMRLDGMTRSREPDDVLDRSVLSVVLSIRNLLYVSTPPSSHIPAAALPPSGRDYKFNPTAEGLQNHLKPAQRKVTATLSKLVLSARAMQYDSGPSTNETPNRIEADAAELERAIVSFVLEVQKYHNQMAPEERRRKLPPKRLHGVYSTSNIGLGLPGAGIGGSWKGFGFIQSAGGEKTPSKVLSSDVVSNARELQSRIDDQIRHLMINLSQFAASPTVNAVASKCQAIVTHLTAFLSYIGDVSIKRHVDVYGIFRSSALPPQEDAYLQAADKGRLLLRTLEAAAQTLYDDGIVLLASSQYMSVQSEAPDLDELDSLATSMKSNLSMVLDSLEALLVVGQDQAELAGPDYQQIIDAEIPRLNATETPYSSDINSLSDSFLESEADDIVDTELAFSKPRARLNTNPDSMYSKASGRTLGTTDSYSTDSNGDLPANPMWSSQETSIDTLVSPASPTLSMSPTEDTNSIFEDEVPGMSSKSPSRPNKLRQLLGDEVPRGVAEKMHMNTKPWYLRPTYDANEILIEPDGTVRAGTIRQLVQRLTAHEHGDPNYNKIFLLTYKSFTTLDELFDLLVQRFWIQPPEELNSREREEWVKLKQTIVRARVLNTFKSMTTEEGFLEKEDLYILDRIKGFVSDPRVIQYSGAKQLLINIERIQRGGEPTIKMTTGFSQSPPQPIVPKSNKKLKLLDIDPLELARQLTILESKMFMKIKATECLQRSKMSGQHNDSISDFIQTFNRIANWVKDAVLAKEDSRKRAAAVKHFINTADRCRTLHNFSSMAAIVSGLNASPIIRLKRTWEQVGQRFMNQLQTSHINTDKNYGAYRATLAKVTPPCVPFFGIYLSDLTFIGDGNVDTLNGNLVNFRKRQRVAEVIQEIKRWQSRPYNFQPVPVILAYVEENLNQFNAPLDYDEQFWQLSLEREPRERDDEKMARLLQESGFL